MHIGKGKVPGYARIRQRIPLVLHLQTRPDSYYSRGRVAGALGPASCISALGLSFTLELSRVQVVLSFMQRLDFRFGWSRGDVSTQGIQYLHWNTVEYTHEYIQWKLDTDGIELLNCQLCSVASYN